MDYGEIIRRAWDIVWNNKWLIVLGIVVALTSGGSISGSGSGYDFGGNGTDRDFENEFEEEFGQEFDFEEDFNFEGDMRALPVVGGLAMAVLIPLICLGMIIGLLLWALGVVARGALVYGSDLLDGGVQTDLGTSWRAAWAKGWRLIGISVLPAIPGLILLVMALGFGGAFYGLTGFEGDVFAGTAGALGITFVAVACIAGLAAMVLGLLRTFAERAAMLEDTAVWDSYRRGWAVLSQNLGPAIVLFLIQIAISFGVGLLMLMATPLLICLCLIIIPLVLIVNGTVAAYFSTLWTLAWRRWTGRGTRGEPVAFETPPAV